jgi:hypothetical protein
MHVSCEVVNEMAYSDEQVEAVIQSAFKQHRAAGHPAPQPEVAQAIRSWVARHADLINKGLDSAKWTEANFAKRLTGILGGAQAGQITAISGEQVATALDGNINSCSW